jgi:hypothetical protein
MADAKTLSHEILLHIAQSLNLPLHCLTAVIGLLNEGGTVPFIARYRKEATSNLDEVQIRDIEAKLAYFRDFVSRRETILASILEQGKLTGELKARIEATFEKSELEDLYLPYRPKRRTKATIARDRGLEPLADCLWARQPTGQSITDYAATFINPEREVAAIEEALVVPAVWGAGSALAVGASYRFPHCGHVKPSSQRNAAKYVGHASSVANCDWNSRRFFGNSGRATPIHYSLCPGETTR